MLRDYLLMHWNELKIGFKLLLEKLRSKKYGQSWMGKGIEHYVAPDIFMEENLKKPPKQVTGPSANFDDLDDSTRRLMFEGMDDTILDDKLTDGLSDATTGKRTPPLVVLPDPVRLQFQGYDSNGLGVATEFGNGKRYILNKDTATAWRLVTGQRFYAKVTTSDLVVEVLTVDNFGTPGSEDYQEAVIEAKRLLSTGTPEHVVRILFVWLDREAGRGRGNEAVDQAIEELKIINQWPYGYKE